ncbi:MAG: efflux RND transporter periplasmic adaptor subunit [Vicinamibacterales bacterium]
MKRAIIVVVLLAAAGGGYYYYAKQKSAAAGETAAAGGPGGQGQGQGRGRGGQGGPGGGGGFGFGGPGGFGGGPRLPMTVELASVKRQDMVDTLEVVGNLIGAATVEALPKTAGRVEAVNVKLGDRVQRGQTLAKLDDREIVEQVKQAKASFDVSAATIRQREADLKLAQTNLDRSKNLFDRQLIPKQTFDDTDAKYQAASAALDLARAQYAQAQARLDELNINLANTVITSPVTGFVGRRLLDPGGWVTPNANAGFISVVDITSVRLVANIIEKDLRRITSGMKANVSVDAYPGETFEGRIAQVAPVLDPATRTAQIEIEVPNREFRLKPGMYAKVSFVVERRANTLVVPANAVVDLNGKKGVFLPQENTARFKPVSLGMTHPDLVEVTEGLDEGARVVSTGAAALREGDRIVLLGQGGGRGGRGGQGGGRGGNGQGGGQQGQGQGQGAPQAAPGGAPQGAPGGEGGQGQRGPGGDGGQRGAGGDGQRGRRGGTTGGN